jgi:aminoglycoside phosphotransferase (APT) family kinase protein
MDTVIREILKRNGINEEFVKLETNGIANDIYATANYILRIPTDHPEANSDAYTEAVAAPVAKKNGIKTPELICFDNSFTLLNRTYSIWERIHGETLGELDNYLQLNNTLREIGFELGKLHINVKSCDDTKGWLDDPETFREYSKEMMIKGLADNHSKDSYLLKLTENKYTDEIFSYKKCFVHGDTNEFNFLCKKTDQLLSVIDWGDAGWGDPAIDFYMIPIGAVDSVLEGYSEIAGNNIDHGFIYRIIFDKVWAGIEENQDMYKLEKDIMELENRLLKRL